MTLLARILSPLDHIKPNGQGWTPQFPTYGDRDNPFSMAEGDDGRLWLHGFVGCGLQAIHAALESIGGTSRE